MRADRERQSMTIHDCHDFHAFSALRRSDLRPATLRHHERRINEAFRCIQVAFVAKLVGYIHQHSPQNFIAAPGLKAPMNGFVVRIALRQQVTRLDRLARSTRDLLNILHTVSKAGAKFRSLTHAWADTTTPHGELMITILAGLATFERHLIKARTDEGRKRAQARNVRFGRPLKLSKYQIEEALARREAGEPLADIGRSYGVSHSTISRL